jgi:hypothetical protein
MFRTDGGHKGSSAPYVATSSGCCCVPLLLRILTVCGNAHPVPTEPSCKEVSQLQCYNPFRVPTTSSQPQQGDASRTSTDADCGDSRSLLSQTWFVATLIGGVGVLCLTVGALLGGYFRAARLEDARSRRKPDPHSVEEALLGQM